MIYLDKFFLDIRPFAIQPDSAFLYWSEQHETIFAALRREVFSETPFTLLTGEIGSGKTLLINELLDDPKIEKNFRIALIKSAHCEGSVMLSQLCHVFAGEIDAGDPWKTVSAGVKSLRMGGISPLVIVDEAQTLSDEGAQVLGQLTTGSRGDLAPVPVLLVGQPELRGIVNKVAFRTLKRSLGVQMHLKPLSADEVGHYINKRLETAGAPINNGIFDPETFPLIHRATNGVPRMINKLCELCLFLASQRGVKRITASSLRDVLINHVDPESLSYTGGEMVQTPQPSNDDLQEPVVQQPSTPRPLPTKAQQSAPEPLEPVPTPKSSPKPTPQQPVAKARSGSKRLRNWVIGGAAAASLAFVLVSNGNDRVELPKIAPLKKVEVDPATATLLQPVPTHVATPLPTMKRVFDLATDPAQLYFDQAIAALDKTEIKIAYARAAIRGHRRGALYLGQLFETGDGVPFAPNVAEKWYAVSENPTLLNTAMFSSVDDLPTTQLTPLFSTAKNGVAEFIWQGRGGAFQLVIGNADGVAIAQYTTPLTAALVELPPGAKQWRIRTQMAANWRPINAR